MTNEEQTNSLVEAVERLNVDAVRDLLDRGVDPNLTIDGLDSKNRATKINILEVLRSSCIASNREFRSAEVEQIIGHLIRKDVDPNVVVAGWPLLVWTSALGMSDCVLALIAKGADVMALTNDKTSALYYAAQRCNITAVKALVDHGADVNHLAGDDVPPLNGIYYGDDSEMINYLRSKGALLLSRDERGEWQMT